MLELLKNHIIQCVKLVVIKNRWKSTFLINKFVAFDVAFNNKDSSYVKLCDLF